MHNSKQSIKKQGNLNPMYGKRHSQETKQKISDSQKERYETIKRALQEKTIFAKAQDDFCARKDVLNHLVNNYELSFNSIQQAVNFLAIVLGKENIARVIQKEIERIVNVGY